MKYSRVIFLFGLLLAQGSFLRAQKVSEYGLKALFIYNFTKFIEWKNDPADGVFIIGILGENSEIRKPLEEIASQKQVNGKKIEVKEWASPEDLAPCHILFIPDGNSKEFERTLTLLEGQNILIICESKGSAKSGAGINFVQKNEKIKFEMNPSNLQNRGLKVSSQLSKLAIIVGEG